MLLCAIGLLNFHWLYNTEQQNATSVIKQRNLILSDMINEHIGAANTVVQVLSTSPLVQQAGYNPEHYQAQLLERYQHIQSSSLSVVYVCSAYDNGLMIINDYSQPDDFDIRDRPWYQDAITAQGRVITSMPFLDAMEENWLVTTSKSFTDLQSGGKGVAAVTLSMSALSQQLRTHSTSYHSIRSSIINRDNILIYHRNPEWILQPFPYDIVHPGAEVQDMLRFSYLDNGQKRIGYLEPVPNTDWLVLTTLLESEITDPIGHTLWQNLLIIVLFAILIAFVQGRLLERRIARPMRLLQQRVTAVLTGQQEPSGQFPQNEIGLVASQVLQLTSKELYLKSQKMEQAYNELALAHSNLAKQSHALEQLANQDKLTKLPNRYALERLLQKHLKQRIPLAIMVLDVDNFKAINRNFGQLEGDKLLQQLAQHCRSLLPTNSILGRWGGDEFMVLWPNSSRSAASELAHKLCKAIARQSFISQQVTISLGMIHSQPPQHFDTLLQNLENQLCQAKWQGRNRVSIEAAHGHSNATPTELGEHGL